MFGEKKFVNSQISSFTSHKLCNVELLNRTHMYVQIFCFNECSSTENACAKEKYAFLFNFLHGKNLQSF